MSTADGEPYDIAAERNLFGHLLIRIVEHYAHPLGVPTSSSPMTSHRLARRLPRLATSSLMAGQTNDLPGPTHGKGAVSRGVVVATGGRIPSGARFRHRAIFASISCTGQRRPGFRKWRADMIGQSVWLACDCDDPVHRGGICDEETPTMTTRSELRKAARQQGWVRRGGRDLCPSCAARTGGPTDG